jgi:cerevisin
MYRPHIAGLSALIMGQEGILSPADLSTRIKALAVNGAITGIPTGTTNTLAFNDATDAATAKAAVDAIAATADNTGNTGNNTGNGNGNGNGTGTGTGRGGRNGRGRNNRK